MRRCIRSSTTQESRNDTTRVPVDGRYFALPIESYDDLTTCGDSDNAWLEIAEYLAAQSIRATGFTC